MRSRPVLRHQATPDSDLYTQDPMTQAYIAVLRTPNLSKHQQYTDEIWCLQYTNPQPVNYI